MLAELIFCGVSGFAIGFFLGKLSGRGGRKYEKILHEARRDGYMDAIRSYGGDALNNKEVSAEEAKLDACILSYDSLLRQYKS